MNNVNHACFQVRVVSWASPQVGNEAFKLYYSALQLSDVTARLTCASDIVPGLPGDVSLLLKVIPQLQGSKNILKDDAHTYVHVCDQSSLDTRISAVASTFMSQTDLHSMKHYFEASRSRFRAQWAVTAELGYKGLQMIRRVIKGAAQVTPSASNINIFQKKKKIFLIFGKFFFFFAENGFDHLFAP